MDALKRTADEAGLDAGPDRPAKSFRIEDFLESMDPSVRIKLRSMFDDGLLQTDDLDDRNIAELRKFDAAVALEILEHYCSSDLGAVRNRRAYLAGAIRRKGHLAKASQDPVIDKGIDHSVQQKLEQLTAAGAIRSHDLDQRCMDTLALLAPHTALTVLDRYCQRDFSEVRNPAAMFMATVKQVVAAEGGDYGQLIGAGKGRGQGGGRGGGRSGGRGRGDSSYQDQYQPPPPPGRPPPPAGPPPTLPSAVEGITALAGVLGMPGLQGVAPPGAMPPPTVVSAGGGFGIPAGVQLPPGAQILPGVQPGAILSTGGLGAPQFIVGPNGVLTPVQTAGGAIIGAPGLSVVQPGMLPAGVPPNAVVAPASVAPPAAALPGVSPEWAAGKKQYGLEQAQLGVRVSEFHGLSPFAVYVHPSPALKLQQLWDEGNELVSMLDDKVWQVLAEIPAAEALLVIEDAGKALSNPHSQIRNINAYFMSVVRRLIPGFGRSAGGQGNDRGGGGGAGYGRDRHGGGHSRDGPSSGSYGGADETLSRGRGPAIHMLPHDLRARAEQLCRDHAPLLREEHFDEGVIAVLNRLGHDGGMKVLEELGNNSMAGVRNFPAYIMGICRRHAPGGGGSGFRGAKGFNSGGRGGGRGSRTFKVPDYTQ